MMEKSVVILIVAAAAIYLIGRIVQKYRRISTAKIGPCGHCCENCPFAKYSKNGNCCPH